MVASMFAAGFAAAPAAAAATDVSGGAADDVEVGNAAATQTVSFTTTTEEITGGGVSDTYVLDVSNATGPGIDVTGQDAPGTGVTTNDISLSGDTGAVSISDVTDNVDSDSEVLIELTDSSADGTHTVTIDVALQHDTTALDNDATTSDDGVEFSVTAQNGGQSTATPFDLVTATGSITPNVQDNGGSALDGVTVDLEGPDRKSVV